MSNDTGARGGVDMSAFDDDGDEFDELVAEARKRADSGSTPEDWGERIVLEEGESGEYRWRGETFDSEYDNRRVFQLWLRDGSLAYMRAYAALNREIDTAKPAVGDRVVIVRGKNYEGKNGTGFQFGVVKAPCSDPLPSTDDDDDDLPF